MPSVSVIIPTYNHADFLGAAIRSVLGQSYQDFDIVVVDDGSRDDPASVAEAFADPRIRVVRQENAGLAAARNTGIRSSAAPFVAFLDADDAFCPDFLKQALDHFARLPPEFGIVACNRIRVDDRGERIPERKAAGEKDREITGREILVRNRFVAEVVARREVFGACGLFDTTLRSSEDRDMWVRASAKYRIYLASEPQLLIRRAAGSMSRHADRMRENMQRVIAKAKASGVAPAGDVWFWRKVQAMNAYEVAWMHHDEGRSALALAGLVRSVALYPFFLRPGGVAEPLFFRVRAARHFLLGCLARPALPGRAGEPSGAAGH